MPRVDAGVDGAGSSGTSVAYTTLWGEAHGAGRLCRRTGGPARRAPARAGRPRPRPAARAGGSREGLGAALRGGSLVVETAEGIVEALAKMQDGEFDGAGMGLDPPPAHGTRV